MGHEQGQSEYRKAWFSLALAKDIFLDKYRTEIIDDRKDYKETRYLTWGMIESRCFCVCYTIREDIRRIISLRPVHKKEKEFFYGNNKND